jgi:hypothetical protein
LWERAWFGRGPAAVKDREDEVVGGWSNPSVGMPASGPGPLDQDRGGPIAQTEAGASMPGGGAAGRGRPRGTEPLLQSSTEVVRPGTFAGDVVTDVHGKWRALFEREAGIEARDAVRIGGRDGKAPACVFQCAAADPAHVILQRVKHRQQQMTA